MAKESMNFRSLMKAMLKNNEVLIGSRSLKKQADQVNRSVSRFNAPEFFSNVENSSSEFRETFPNNLGITTDVFSTEFGLAGKLPRYGLDYRLGITWNQQNQEGITGFPAIDRSGEQMNVELGFNLLEDAGFLIGNFLFDEKRMEYQIADANNNQQVQSLILNLIDRYLTLYLLQQNINSSIEIQEKAEKLYKSYRTLSKEGKISKVDLYSAKIQVNNQKQLLVNQRERFREAKRAVFTLVGGMNPAYVENDYEFEAIEEPLLLEAPEVDPKMVEIRNPDLNLKKRELELSSLRIKNLSNKVLPTLKLNSGYSQGRNPIIPPLSENVIENENWFVGLRLTVPLNNIAAKTDLKVEKINNYQLRKQAKTIKRNANLQIQGLLAELQIIEDQIGIVEETIDLAEKRYKASLPLIRINSATRFDIFFFQDEIITNKIRLTELKTNSIRKRAQILFAQGALNLGIK